MKAPLRFIPIAFIAGLMALLLALRLGGQAPAVAANGVSPEGMLNPDGTLDLSSGFNGSLNLDGWDAFLDPQRGPVLRPVSEVTAWSALPNQGLDGNVAVMAVLGTDLYVGGNFTQTGDGTVTNLGRIVRYDTSAGTWHALSNQGLNGNVRSLVVSGTDLYVGGSFTQTGDGTVALNSIARYDTNAGTWHALSNQGLNGTPRALAVFGKDLYVGGQFTQTGDGTVTNLNKIARYDTNAGTWHALPNQGLNGTTVWDLAVSGTDLYVGGDFTKTFDGAVTNLNYIARYDTNAGTWNALPNQGFNDIGRRFLVSGTDLYVGGNFTQTGDGTVTNLGRIVRYDTNAGTWNALSNQGFDDGVWGLAMSGTDLYVGGVFTQTGDGTVTSLGGIARYDTNAATWNALPNQGFDSAVIPIVAMSSTELYVTGSFTQTGDGTVTSLGHIARGTLAADAGGGDSNGGSAGDDGEDGDKFTRKCTLEQPGSTCQNAWVKVTSFENTVLQTSTVVMKQLAADSAGGNFQLGDQVFDIKVYGPDGQEITSFNPPLEVCIKPTNALLKQADWNFSNLQMFHSHAGGPWTALYDTYEKDGKLCAKTYQLSEFAIGVAQLPATGFAPGVVTELVEQPAEKMYFDLADAGDGHLSSDRHLDGDFMLEIPALGVEMPIVGVPLTGQGWDVSWLGGAAGYLEGTAYPTWAGNTAITAHVWDNLNNPGPFVDLHTLKHGDEIIIHAFGQAYTYEVRALTEVRPNDLSALPHSDYDMLTLITCKGFDTASGEYPWRLAVNAVLVDVK